MRNPGGCLIENRTFDPVEEIAAIAKHVFDHAALVDLVFQIVLPLFDLRESGEIPLLCLLGFVNPKPQAFRETFSSSEIVCSVGKGLEGLASWVFLGDGWVMVEFFGDFGVRVETFLEHSLELRLIRLPHHDTEVSGRQVNVEKRHPWVGDKETTDVGQLEVVVATPLGDVLQVEAGTEGVFGAGETVSFGTSDVEGTSHTPVSVEWSVDKG